jgi:quinol monooxygenase YgiN
MKKNQFVAITAMLCAVFFTTACNNAAPVKEETTDKTTSTAPEPADKPAATAPTAFVPFKVINITQTVKDFATWKIGYDANDSMRLANGLTKLSVCRDDANPNKVYVFLKVADLQKAKDFAASPGLKMAMQKAGVIGLPAFLYSDVRRFEESPVELKGRVRIACKVKDFDTWLKGYDAEGKATRAANGLVDRGISRNINEPNLIYITFAISDLAKAKARFNSPELKKIREDAGVISKPVIDFYTSVD